MATNKFPSTAKETVLHQRVLARDPIAPVGVFEAFMEALFSSIRYDLNCLDEEAYDSRIDAVLTYLDNPAQYVPKRGKLSTYLMEIGKRRAIDQIRSRTARHRREKEFAAVLELGATTPKEEMNLKIEARELWTEVEKAMPSESDRKTLQLILAGERSTEVLAKELGLENLPLHKRQKEVKRHRDRLLNALKSLGNKL